MSHPLCAEEIEYSNQRQERKWDDCTWSFCSPTRLLYKTSNHCIGFPLITKNLYFGLFCFCYIRVNGGFSFCRTDQLMAQYVQWHLFPINPELQEPLWTSSSVELCSSLLLVSKIQENTRKRKGEASFLLCDYFD